MNQLHGRFEIANEDFLYVLSTLVIEPFRWNERFGWRRSDGGRADGHVRVLVERRPPDEHPRRPAELRGARGFNVAFERERFAFTEAGHRVASAMVDMFVRKIPGVPLALGRRGVYALLDDPLLDALGLPHPTTAERRAARGSAQAARTRRRAAPARRRPRMRTKVRRRKTYPQGWEIGSLGPETRRAATFLHARPRSSVDRAADFESACGGSTPPGAISRKRLQIEGAALS